jgi:hypothetical protein
MNHLQLNISGPLKIFNEQFEELLLMDDYFQFFTNRKKAGNNTFLCSDIFRAEKISTVILEEYSIKGKLSGNVIVAYPDPDPDYDVPVFTFQLGGNGSKSIALLDISPTLTNTDYGPLIPVFEKYKKLLNMEPSRIDWVNSICSPYLLHCQYDAMDRNIFLEAAKEYLAIWIEHYYKPGKKLPDEKDIENVCNAIFKYKRVLHNNNPAYAFSIKNGADRSQMLFSI